MNACQYCYDHELPHVCQRFFDVRGYCRHDKRFTDDELAMVWRGIAEDERERATMLHKRIARYNCGIL